MATRRSKSSAISEAVTPYSESFEETTLKLSPEILVYLREIAEKRGVSTGDIVRIALGTYKFLKENSGPDSSVILQDKDRTTKVAI